RHDDGVLPAAADLRHARAVLREDPRHPEAHRRRGVQWRLQLRRHALRSCGEQPPALRQRGDARAQAPHPRRGPADRARRRRPQRRTGGVPPGRRRDLTRADLVPPDQALERQLRELAAVHQSLRALTSTLELPEILRAVLDSIKTFTAAEGLSLLLY